VRRILGGLDGQLHAAGVDDQEQQQVDRPVARVLELALLDGPRDRPAGRLARQHLEVRHLVHADHPQALGGQTRRMYIAPQHLLGALLELGVEVRRLPVARAVRLQIHPLQNPLYCTRADSVHDAVGDGLMG
jgi:hypothetical protein